MTTTVLATPPQGAEAWVTRLRQHDMPVLNQVVTELNQLTGRQDTQIHQLTSVILKDPNLTSQVLRIANTVHYNPTGVAIDTINRAIVLIGFVGVKSICLTLMTVNSLLKEGSQRHLKEAMARSFHAAVQARNMIKLASDHIQEDIFTATLLYNLGEMAFWSTGGETAQAFGEMLEATKAKPQVAIKRYIGTSFDEISGGLAQHWHLGETLQNALDGNRKPDAKTVAIRLGDELSRVAEHGWDDKGVHETLCKVAKFTRKPYVEVVKMVTEASDQASAIAATYGAEHICHLIPSSTLSINDPRPDTAVAASAAAAPAKPAPKQYDPEALLKVLQEMEASISRQTDVNTIFKMVLNGLHNGIGLERVCIAVMLRGKAQAKYVAGPGTQAWPQEFNFSIGAGDDNLLTHAIRKQKPHWIDEHQYNSREIKPLYNADIQRVIGHYPCLISSIRIGFRNVALVYADRADLGGNLDDDQFESFQHFIDRTQYTLTELAKNSRAS